MRKNKGLQWVLAAAAAAFLLTQAAAFAQTSPVVKVAKIRDFARISFEWPREVRLQAGTTGNELKIQFEQPSQIDPAPILRGLKPYISNVQQSADGRSLSLTMNRPYKIRSFVSSNLNGIDILHVNDQPVQADVSSPPAPPTPPVLAETKKPEPELAKPRTLLKTSPLPQPKPQPTLPKEQETAQPLEKPVESAPPAAQPQPEAAKAVEAKPTETAPPPEEQLAPAAPVAAETAEVSPPPAAAEPVTEQPVSPAEVVPAAEEPKTETSPAEDFIGPSQPSAPSQLSDLGEEEPLVDLTVTAETKEKITLLNFPWQERVGVTAFRRGGQNYLYFTRKAQLNLEAVQAVEGIESATVSPLGSGMLVMIKTAKPGLVVDKAPNDYAWKFRLMPMEMPPLHPIRSIPQIQPPLKPHVLLQVLEVGDGVNFIDPYIGDSLVLVPSFQGGDGVAPLREFLEFILLPTSQGLVVKPKVDDLRVARLRNGMKITRPLGLQLSEDLPPLVVADSSNTVAGEDVLFPYAQWKTPEDKTPADFVDGLMRDIPFAAPEQKQALRLRLAQWSLAEERPREVLGLLDIIENEAPEFYQQHSLSALRGAANFMIYRYPEALDNFAHAELDDFPETKFWRDMLSVVISGEGRGAYLNFYKNYISKYPPYMARRLAMPASEILIQHQQYNGALKIFDLLQKADALDPIYDFAQYQIARVSAATGQKKAAEKIWKKLAKSKDNFIRSRAVFALTNYQLREAKITIAQAIAQLDPLRIVWRGDEFEMGLLRFTGDLYEADNQPREAMRAYRELIQNFPDNPENFELLGKMSDMFIALFNAGGADKMDPLEALALYYEFRDLTPLGEEGDKMVRNLADRLVGVDLLDRAAALLEHQIRFRLAGEERSRVGARLALIYLLNRQPKEALRALEITGYGQNPEDLQHTRMLLTARGLADVSETKRAIRLLEGDESSDAALLRLGIYWNQKDWKNTIAIAESILGHRTDPSATVSDEETGILLKLALSYVFEQQPEQVQYLRDYFLPLMKENPQRQLFDFITRDTPVDYRNMTRLSQSLSATESFLAGYRKKMQENGLSKAIP